MIRTDIKTTLRWKKIGGGSLRLPGKGIIKPGQTFTATRSEIPVLFLRNLLCLDDALEQKKVDDAVKAEEKLLSTPEDLYEVQPRENAKGWYDVVNMTSSKPINEKPLRKKDAEELIESIS